MPVFSFLYLQEPMINRRPAWTLFALAAHEYILCILRFSVPSVGRCHLTWRRRWQSRDDGRNDSFWSMLEEKESRNSKLPLSGSLNLLPFCYSYQSFQ